MKKLIAIAVLAIAVLAGCNMVGSIINPIIGTWELTILGVVTTDVYNADGTCSETITVLGVGTTTNGTWTSANSTLTVTWSDSSTRSDTYSFNSDNSTMTLVGTSGGLSRTFTRTK